MSEESLELLGELLEGSLAQPPEDRLTWLADACPDAGVRRQVVALLARHDEAERYFDDLAGDIARRTRAELSAAVAKDLSIGPYRVQRELGRGGMGVVYLAERSDGHFDRQVALKLIRKGMENDEAVRRFLAERQSLARLDHPNIARLLDGGVTEDGLPYLVMERVEGKPLDQYCNEERLDIDARLALFITITEAVQYAHRNLIIHRDLKPSNVLITNDGVVKLVDFGIAKILSDEEDGTATTRTQDRVLTPEYAAPEQILGQPVSTATDVYSLGVMLYELLTNRRPFRLRGRTAREIERLVAETEPLLPSSRVAREDNEDDPPLQSAADTRSTTPAALRRRLRGDLDRIALMALRKEPERRYSSAEQLAEDIRRHLRGLPVAARPDTLAYRTGRFLRRNAIAVAMASLVLLLVSGAAIVLAFQSARLANERDRAEQVSALLVDLFRLADPQEALGKTITAREVLERGSERIRDRLADQPDVRADLFDLMGQVYRNLGLYADARPLLEDALALRRDRLPESHRKRLQSLVHLAELRRLEGDFQAAQVLVEEALRSAEATGGAGELMPTLLDLRGKVAFARGSYDAAEEDFGRALELNRQRRREADAAENLNNLAVLFFSRGRFEEAEKAFHESLEIRRRVLGSNHPFVAATLNNLATLYARRGELEQAASLFSQALELYRAILGDEHPRVATLLNNLALLHFEQDDLDRAEPLFRQSLELRRRLLDPPHPDLAQSLSNLGLLLHRRGREEEAEALLREALEMSTKALGVEHPTAVSSMNNLAMTLQSEGQTVEAERLLRQGLASLRLKLGDDHPLVATSLHNLGMLLVDTGDPTAAESRLREALAIRRAKLPPSHPYTSLTLHNLGRLLTVNSRPAEAEELLREALENRQRHSPTVPRELAESRAALGLCLLELERPGEARPLLEAAVEELRATEADDPLTLATSAALERLD